MSSSFGSTGRRATTGLSGDGEGGSGGGAGGGGAATITGGWRGGSGSLASNRRRSSSSHLAAGGTGRRGGCPGPGGGAWSRSACRRFNHDEITLKITMTKIVISVCHPDAAKNVFMTAGDGSYPADGLPGAPVPP